MANSRIYLVCKHCGEGLCIGNGYFGDYTSQNEDIHNQLNAFYRKHEHGICSDDLDCSDNARNHFAVLEEGETLDVLTADVVPKREVDRWKENFQILDAECSRLEKYETNYYNEVIKAKTEVAREIFEEIEDVLKIVKFPCVSEDGYITPLRASYWAIDPNDYAELKKKYLPTDNESEGN